MTKNYYYHLTFDISDHSKHFQGEDVPSDEAALAYVISVVQNTKPSLIQSFAKNSMLIQYTIEEYFSFNLNNQILNYVKIHFAPYIPFIITECHTYNNNQPVFTSYGNDTIYLNTDIKFKNKVIQHF